MTFYLSSHCFSAIDRSFGNLSSSTFNSIPHVPRYTSFVQETRYIESFAMSWPRCYHFFLHFPVYVLCTRLVVLHRPVPYFHYANRWQVLVFHCTDTLHDTPRLSSFVQRLQNSRLGVLFANSTPLFRYYGRQKYTGGFFTSVLLFTKYLPSRPSVYLRDLLRANHSIQRRPLTRRLVQIWPYSLAVLSDLEVSFSVGLFVVSTPFLSMYTFLGSLQARIIKNDQAATIRSTWKGNLVSIFRSVEVFDWNLDLSRLYLWYRRYIAT